MRKPSAIALFAILCSLNLCVMVVPSYATTVTVGGTSVLNSGQVSPVVGATTVDFDFLQNGAPQSFTSGIANYSNVLIFSNDPPDIANDSTHFASVQAGNDLTISFSQPISYFGFYWGSPDPANTITLFNGAQTVFSYTGLALHNDLGVPFGLGSGAFVNFTASSDEAYTSVVISAAGSFPFENDNNAFVAQTAAVPEPSGFMLLSSGLAGLAGMMIRRKRNR